MLRRHSNLLIVVLVLQAAGCGDGTTVDPDSGRVDASLDVSPDASVEDGGAEPMPDAGTACDCEPEYLWDRLVPEAPSVTATSDGAAVFSGRSSAPIDLGGGERPSGSYLVSYSHDGEHQWDRILNDGEYGALASDGSGNIVVVGGMSSTSSVDLGGGGRSGSWFAASYGGDGAYRWDQVGRAADEDWDTWFIGVSVGSGGAIATTGQFRHERDFGGGTRSFTGFSAAFVAAFNESGEYRWDQVFDGPGVDAGLDVAVDSAGNVVSTGFFSDTVDFGDGPRTAAALREAYLVSLSPDGSVTWVRTPGGGSQPAAVAIDASGEVTWTGASSGTVDFGGGPRSGTPGSANPFIARYTADGSHLWDRLVDGDDDRKISDVAVDDAGNVVIVGSFQGRVDFGGGDVVPPGYGMFVVSYAADGTFRWQRTFANGGAEVLGFEVAVSPRGDLIVVTGLLASSRTVDFGGGTRNGDEAPGFMLALGCSCSSP